METSPTPLTHCPRCGESVETSDRFCIACGQDLATYRRLWPEAQTATTQTAQPTRPPSSATSAGAPPVAAPLSATPALEDAEHTPDKPRIQTYSGWAAALLAVCWTAFWAAIPALKYAGQAELLLEAGDIPGARESAEKAKIWCWVTLWAGLALWAFALTLIVTL